MSLTEAARGAEALEACLEDLDELIAGLDRYAPTVVAVALRTHLEALLQALLESRQCSAVEVRDFLRELEREALQYETE